MDKIGDAQFRVMCDMWGVDAALKALKHMGMTATAEQITAARDKEMAVQERWNVIFNKKPIELKEE